MCRSIKTLFNSDREVTRAEVEAASLQFVRKVSGFRKPSKLNERVFNEAIDAITKDTQKMLDSLSTNVRAKKM